MAEVMTFEEHRGPMAGQVAEPRQTLSATAPWQCGMGRRMLAAVFYTWCALAA
jgi:hypothetical protein